MNRERIQLAITTNNNSAQGLIFSDIDISGENLDGLNLEGAIFNNAII